MLKTLKASTNGTTITLRECVSYIFSPHPPVCFGEYHDVCARFSFLTRDTLGEKTVIRKVSEAPQWPSGPISHFSWAHCHLECSKTSRAGEKATRTHTHARDYQKLFKHYFCSISHMWVFQNILWLLLYKYYTFHFLKLLKSCWNLLPLFLAKIVSFIISAHLMRVRTLYLYHTKRRVCSHSVVRGSSTLFHSRAFIIKKKRFHSVRLLFYFLFFVIGERKRSRDFSSLMVQGLKTNLN